MAPLRNARHEKFCQALFEGKSASEAFVIAGYSENRGNATRLKANESVQARVAELQNAVAEKKEVTVASLLDELEHARIRADSLDQLSASVKAIEAKAKVSGLLTQKIEIGNPGSFDDCETFPAIAGKMIEELIEGFYPVDTQDREGLVGLLERQAREVQEFLASIKARPIAAERIDTLPTKWQDIRPFSAPRRLSNGR